MSVNNRSHEYKSLLLLSEYERKTIYRWLNTLGVSLIVLGIVAMVWSAFSTAATVIFFGWALCIGGIAEFVHSLSEKMSKRRLLNFFDGIFYVVAGLFILRHPGASAAVLTMLVGSFLIVAGIFRTIFSIMGRWPMWGWFCFSGMVSAGLGLMIVNHWPSSAITVIGTFLGIELVSNGISMLSLGTFLRHEGIWDINYKQEPSDSNEVKQSA